MLSELNQEYQQIFQRINPSTTPQPDDEELSSQLKLRHLIETPDPVRYGKWLEVPIETYKGRTKRVDDKSRNSAILFRQKINAAGVILKEQLEIQSEPLRAFLADVHPNDRELVVETKPIIIPKPYRPLFFLREKIRDRLSTATNPILSAELEILQQFLESRDGLKDVIEKYDALVLHNKISFDILWTIFPPLERVLYHDEDNQLEQVYMVELVHRTISERNWVTTYELLRYHHNGTTAGICREKLITPYFMGTVDIRPENLPIIPLRYMKEKEPNGLESRLIDRGKRYIEVQSQKFSLWEVHGTFWYVRSETVEGMISFGEDKLQLDTKFRVIVDARAAREVEPVKDPQIIYPCFSRYLASFESSEEEPIPISRTSSSSSLSFMARLQTGSSRRRRTAEDQDVISVGQPSALRTEAVGLEEADYLLCPPRTDAFLLDKRIWIWALIGSLETVNWYPDPFNTLQLPVEKKDLIKDLVTGFNTANPFAGFDDIVRGKGKGLIFLLHGKPGLGKTFTAETIAEEARRPLYHVTTGELSVDVKRLQEELGTIFKLGWRWGAVVLIDEADVLMSERDLHNLSRSAIVAVFLRLIEYYQGLLFLTTNREEDFDQAFYNRIHVSIEYPELSPEARTNIWENLLTKKQDSINLDASWSEVEFSFLGDLECNGRDI
ncbi:Fc.00g055340.m01.CDS01 [Cosmosporella sp. VM-42]